MSTLAMEEKKEPKSHSLEILEKINNIRNNLEDVRLYFVKEQDNGKFSEELLNLILPALLYLKHIGLTEVKKDLETLQNIKEALKTAKMNAVMIIDVDKLDELGYNDDTLKIVELDPESVFDPKLRFVEKYSLLPMNYKKSLKAYLDTNLLSILKEDKTCCLQ